MYVDMHLDTPWITTKYGSDFTLKFGGAHSLVSRTLMGLGGPQAAVFALYLPDAMQTRYGIHKSQLVLKAQYDWLTQQEGWGETVFCALEGGRLINESLERLEMMAKEWGIKYLSLTHNFNTSWADSATDTILHHGLSKFGIKVVKKCEELGVLVDVSHSADKTVLEVLDHATKPVIASHSGCRQLIDHPRNLTDALMREIAKTGGVICIPFARNFVGKAATCISDHLLHAYDVVGPKHVGIGSDIDGAVLSNGIRDIADWRWTTVDALAIAGLDDSEIKDIGGKNVLRLMGIIK